jgi:hypothetical protein
VKDSPIKFDAKAELALLRLKKERRKTSAQLSKLLGKPQPVKLGCLESAPKRQNNNLNVSAASRSAIAEPVATHRCSALLMHKKKNETKKRQLQQPGGIDVFILLLLSDDLNIRN